MSSFLRRNSLLVVAAFIATALVLKFIFADQFLGLGPWWLQISAAALIFIIGIGFVFRGTSRMIEETTDVLKDRTGLAGGFLQSFGTAFPDMIIGIVAAILSLQVRNVDYVRAVNLAVLAAAATFGSNIYNILHSTWCVWRQNRADTLGREVLMFPPFASFGTLKPVEKHETKPTAHEMDGAISVLTALTLLTTFVAISMVLFGRIGSDAFGMTGDLYQLVPPVGIVLFMLSAAVLYFFRKSERPGAPTCKIAEEERAYARFSTPRIWFELVLAGVAILVAAEAMVRALEVFSDITHLPFVVTGVLAGIIGCLSEMIIVHNFSIHPKGRIGDAIVGVAMDNIITTLGAAIVAVIGGIFLGGGPLILIFIVILAGNTLLIEQIAKFKNRLPRMTG